MKTFFVAFVVVIIVSDFGVIPVAYAQIAAKERNELTFTGRIVTEMGTPVPFAVVSMKNTSENIEHRSLATSKSDGIFAFHGLVAAKYRIWITDLDGNVREYPVTVSAEDDRCNLVFTRTFAIGNETLPKRCAAAPGAPVEYSARQVPEYFQPLKRANPILKPEDAPAEKTAANQQGNTGVLTTNDAMKSFLCPNPTNAYATVNFTLSHDGAVNFALYTADGKIVSQWKQHASEGINEVPVDLASFAVGRYFLRIFDGSVADVLPLNIVR